MYDIASQFQLLGFILDYTALLLIMAFGVRLLLNLDVCVNDSQRQYQRGLGFYFISIASSALIYGIDLTSRTYFSGRIFPAEAQYDAMGYVFDSFHPESYFILILMFILISLHFIMKPIEKFMMNRKN